MQLRKIIFMITSIVLWGSITTCGFISYAEELQPVDAPEATIVEPQVVEEESVKEDFIYKEIELLTYETIGEFTITAYCPCSKCCGRNTGITASGTEAQEGMTVAADIDVLPFGTKISIDGIGERVVEDIPADFIVEKYDGKIIDLYFDSHQDALEFGKQSLTVSREVTKIVSNELKIHLSSENVIYFITLANEFEEDLDIVDGHNVIDAKSTIGVCSLDLQKEFILRINTEDETVIQDFNSIFQFVAVQE